MRLSFLDRFSALGPAFGGLLLSDTQTILALMVGQVALPWWIASAGGAHDLAVYGALTSAFAIVAMPALSPLGDRLPKRRLIQASLVAFALAAAAVAALASLGRYDLRLLLLLGAVPVLAMAVLLPAINSLVIELVPPERLSPAMGVQQSAQSIGRMVGPAIGGAVLGLAGTAAALWVNCLLLIGAVLAARALPEGHAPHAQRRAWMAELMAGMRANWRIPIERGWILTNFLSWIFLAPGMAMLLPLKIQSLALSGAWLGACEAGLSIGLLLGSLGGSNWMVERFGRFGTRVGGAAGQGLSLALAGLAHNGAVLVACFVVTGFMTAAVTLVGKTHRMLARPQAFRARMVAGAVTTTHIAGMIGPTLAGLALTRASVTVVYTGFGCIGALFALGLSLVPGYRAFMALEHAEVDNFYGRTFPRAFEEA